MKFLKRAFEILKLVSGSLLFALGFNLFLTPSQITPGGITGLSLVVNHMFPMLTVGTISLILNIPLFFLGKRKLGGTFIINTVIATVFMSIMLDVLTFSRSVTSDPLLAAIYGGVLMGGGMGITFLCGGSTGGMDIVARVLRLKCPSVSIGKLLLIIDVIIVTAAAFVFKNINNALYAVITMYVASLVIDAILYGLNYAKVAFIITAYEAAICEKISSELVRGATLINCVGAHTGNTRRLIMCAIKRNQITALKSAVYDADPDAFMMLSEAHEVLGYGFKRHDKSAF